MSFYGYKNHIKVDHGTKLIGAYASSDASTQDSQELETLIDKDDAGQKLYADSAYIGQEESFEWCGMQSEVHEKSTRAKKLTKSQKASNKRKSKYWARGEHEFGFLTNTMHAMDIHTIGITRATTKIDLLNLTYNWVVADLSALTFAFYRYDKESGKIC